MAKNERWLTEKIHKIIDIHPAIRYTMSNELINVRKLAKFIIDQYFLDESLDAVISAIRRYDPKPSILIFENAQKIIKQSTKMSTKNQIVSIDMNKDQSIQQLLPRFFSIIHYHRGEIVRIFQTEKSIKIFIDQKNLEKIKKIIPKNQIKEVKRNLAEINIQMNLQSKDVPGRIALIVDTLAINNINLEDIMSCGFETILYVSEIDLVIAYRAIYQLTH